MLFDFFRIVEVIYDHYVKFRKYGKVHRRKEKSSIIGHIELNTVITLRERERHGLISMLKSLFSLFS